MKFGEKLKLLLEFKDIKQKDFAAVLHISPSTLSGYLNSDRQPDFELVKQIASVLGVSTDYLLDYNNKANEPLLHIRELAMLTNFRALSKEKQEIILSLIELLSEK